MTTYLLCFSKCLWEIGAECWGWKGTPLFGEFGHFKTYLEIKLKEQLSWKKFIRIGPGSCWWDQRETLFGQRCWTIQIWKADGILLLQKHGVCIYRSTYLLLCKLCITLWNWLFKDTVKRYPSSITVVPEDFILAARIGIYSGLQA